MSEDQLERVGRLVRKLDDQAAARVQPVSNPERDSEYLRLALGDLQPSAEPKTSLFSRLWMRLLPRGKSSFFSPFPVAVGLGVATAFLVFTTSPWLHPDALPKYQLEIPSDRTVRGDRPAPKTDEPSQVGEDSLMSITLRPAKLAPSGVEVRAYRVEHGRPQPWPVAMSVSKSGTFSLRQTPRSLSLPPGSTELLFVLAHPGDLPSTSELEDALSRSSSAASRKWQMERRTVVVHPSLDRR